MTDSEATQTRRFGGVVKAVLLSATVAFVGLLAVLFFSSRHALLAEQWQQALFLCLMAIAVLTVLLAGLVWSGSGLLTRAILGGVLGGLSAVVNAALALAVFDYSVAGGLEIAVRILPLVVFASPMGAVVGLIAGFIAGGTAVLIGWLKRPVQSQPLEQPTAIDIPRPKRWLRLALLWSMVAALGAALALPVFQELHRRHAVLALRACGADVSVSTWIGWRSWLEPLGMAWNEELPIYSLESVHSVTLRGDATDADLALVARLDEVTSLRGMVNSSVTDEGLKHLAALRSLTSLSLDDTAITDAGLVHVSKLQSLEILSFNNTAISDEGLRQIAALTNLTQVFANDTQITDEGLQHLSGLTRLTHLELAGTRITGAGVKHLAPLQSLVSLDLGRTHLTQPGLGDLSKLSQLWFFDLSGAQFEEPAFQDLADLGNAPITLVLRETDVSYEAVAALAKSLPRARIVASPRALGAPARP